MSRNHEVTKKNDLLNPDGTLREPGWSKSLIQTYNRESIAAPKFRIKEWDYYLILADKHAVAFTISDDGYIGMQSASLLVFDEKNPWEQTSSILNFFPMGKFKLPRTSDAGDIKYHDKKLDLEFLVKPGERRIVGEYRQFKDGKTLNDLTITADKLYAITSMVDKGDINRNAGRKILIAVIEDDVDPVAYCKENGLDKKFDTSAIEAVIDKIIAANEQAVADYKSGKVKALQALFGACMKELKGAGDPAVIKELLEKKMSK